MNRAALYLRSSKDRHEVSIPSQRVKLKELAQRSGLTVVNEYQDAVESGATENRPGFPGLSKREIPLLVLQPYESERDRHRARSFRQTRYRRRHHYFYTQRSRRSCTDPKAK